jgi:nucleotide-binding universal stress UspA family protein
MSILCATDFSDHAPAARTVAALIAARMKTPLHLAHSVELAGERLEDELGLAYAASARKHLHFKAERLRELGATVEIDIQTGPADESMLKLAKDVSAQLIVIGALGQRSAKTWKLGSRADRLSQLSHVPVLVVRDAEPFSAWLRGERPLRIVLGADRSQTTLAALRLVDQLRQLGPCDVTALHLYWPPAEFTRLGFSGLLSYEQTDPEVSAVLERELRAHLATSHPLSIRLEPHLGRLGDRVASIARKLEADLVVVGSHPRSNLRGILEGSVSRVVAHEATMSVACVPTARSAGTVASRMLRNVLVATDFSPIGNSAIRAAYGLAANNGGSVHLVHVAKSQTKSPLEPHDVMQAASPTPEQREVRRQLEALIPAEPAGAAEMTTIHIVESNETARAICQAAERLDVDVVCLGSHGRSALASALLGSVARGVLEHAHRPVLLTPTPRE